jgi:hypothetical protein
MEYSVVKIVSFQCIPNWNCLLFIKCFHGNIVLLIVFHYNHTIYSKSEYFVITVVSIIFKPNQTIFSTLEFLV